MRVLVVDDNPSKLRDVVAILIDAGVAQDRITEATTGLQAREHLHSTHYDILVLDLLLPMHSDSDADPRGGMNLLTEIKLSDRFQRPSRIVALTEFDDLKVEFDTKFNDGTWEIERYDPAEGGWRSRLKARAAYAMRCSTATPVYETDLCILTALQSPELDAVRDLHWGWSNPEAFDDVGYLYRGTFGHGRSAVAISAPRMGMVAAATLTTKVICSLRPRILVMLGICAGFEDHCRIGDVILADPAWDWQMGKYTLDAFEIQPDQIGAPSEISQKAVLLKTDRLLADFWQDSTVNKPGHIPQLRVGPLASGAAVLADDESGPAIKRQHRKALGVDMEVYGVYSAARDASNPRPMTFALKGVCDYADPYKNDDFQKYASEMSAKVLELLLVRYESELFI